MADIFIACPLPVRATGERLADEVERLGARVAFDMELTPLQPRFSLHSERPARTAKAVLGCWGPDAIRQHQVIAAIESARRRDVLIPIEIEPFDRNADLHVDFLALDFIKLGDFNHSAGARGTTHALQQHHRGDRKRSGAQR